MQVLHISAECYPAAKTGGLADVVGSLPKYQTEAGVLSAAVIPKYALKWMHQHEWVTVYGGAIRVDWRTVGFSIQQEKNNTLGFPLFVVDIPGLFDRPGIYNDPSGHPYGDEVERYIVFQQAVLQWVLSFADHERPRVLHCHDHHTGLIPFMVKYCPQYHGLAMIPTVFTIHNGQYQGMFGRNNLHLMPFFEATAFGLLEWNGIINPMASALRCAWAVTTVSETYLYELHQSSMGLEGLFRDEWRKQSGIINGIDSRVWDPATDPSIQHRLENNDIQSFKLKNKKALCEWFALPEDQPIISFIGRLVGEKGCDMLPDAYRNYIHAGGKASFLVLGTGEPWTQNQFRSMAYQYPGRFNAIIDYNEALAHQIYAGSYYLIMPSRVEPCGLNQMYSMRYGTIPIVHSVGGLKDTVPDIGEPGGTGRGIRFDHFHLGDIGWAIHRAASMWHHDPSTVAAIRERIMAIDFSWERTIEQYFTVYRNAGASIRSERRPPKVVESPVADETSKSIKTPVAQSVKPKAAVKKSVAKSTKSEVAVKEPATKSAKPDTAVKKSVAKSAKPEVTVKKPAPKNAKPDTAVKKSVAKSTKPDAAVKKATAKPVKKK
ncbi:MAG: glycogen/starch synthase [Lewinellaceae bacterium]|nr:glycogen/starch synthase [Lewinellaceae bacterium]